MTRLFRHLMVSKRICFNLYGMVHVIVSWELQQRSFKVKHLHCICCSVWFCCSVSICCSICNCCMYLWWCPSLWLVVMGLDCHDIPMQLFNMSFWFIWISKTGIFSSEKKSQTPSSLWATFTLCETLLRSLWVYGFIIKIVY